MQAISINQERRGEEVFNTLNYVRNSPADSGEIGHIPLFTSANSRSVAPPRLGLESGENEPNPFNH
jgi:hypothetical protein